MENQEYVIKGTIDGMIKILTNDFGMPEDEAKYFIYIKINQHNKDAENTISKDELDLWYLSDNDKYKGEIFKTLSVSDIQTSNSDGKCDYQEGNWKCTYFGQHEACTCNTEKVKLSFENLAQKGILKGVGDRSVSGRNQKKGKG